jgi:hypothetical protein
MEESEKLEPFELKHLFDATIVIGADLAQTEVYAAMLRDGTRFTRVILWPGDTKQERIVDVDYWEGLGWIDMYTGEPSVWSELVAPSLDYHNAHRKNA